MNDRSRRGNILSQIPLHCECLFVDTAVLTVFYQDQGGSWDTFRGAAPGHLHPGNTALGGKSFAKYKINIKLNLKSLHASLPLRI